MNYIFIIDNLGSGGAERQIVALAISTKQKNHNVTILGYAKGDHFLETIKLHGIDYFLIEESNPFKRILKFRYKIRKLNPDVIVAYLRTSAFLAEIAALPIKKFKLVVAECNNIYNKFSLRNLFFLQFHRIADVVTTNSECTSSAVVKRAPYLKKKMRVLYNGLDLNKFKPAEQYIPNQKKNFVVVSSHQRHKNARSLILALKKVKDLQNGHCPIIYWYGSDLSEYTGSPSDAYIEAKRLIEENNLQEDFFLMSPVCDIENVYRKVDALIQCSFWEGLPNAVCEGMACGLPVLMSNVSDYKVLTEGNGTYFDPNSIESITQAINWFCNLSPVEINKLRLVSRKKAEDLFVVEKMVAGHINVG